MLRQVFRTGLGFGIFSTEVLDQDKLSHQTETEKKVDLSVVQNETGWDRIKGMFETDEFGTPSKECITIMHVGAMSLFVGAMYGGIIHSRVAYMNFIKNNQATVYHDHLEAKKKLQDQVTKSFGKGAWKWGWRLSLFCTSFVSFSTMISVYRGSSGILEYIGAGFISGSLYKFNMGPRGWIVGGALGSALGFVAGCATVSLLNLTGMSMDEVRYWQYHWKQERTNYLNKGLAEYLAKKEDDVIYYHNKKMGEAGKNLGSLDSKIEK
ncbi:RPII140-upstream gene protein [Asbolus verrucosus]|uniref:Complex I assembly factor TIMMDC1, mitochondrial n=1 Tax=Asbolus verrucosus TaxID=1661398 RepID=A0A482WE42_ASBVE|nr:RPII140-upstream gene protein [Asbolus verrucosus]